MGNKLHKELNAMEEDRMYESAHYPIDVSNQWADERYGKVLEGIKLLADAANSGSVRELAPMMLDAIASHHRTLQQELVEGLINTISMYGDTAWDGRNKVAVAMCRIVSEVVEEEGITIPKVTMEGKR